MSKKFSFQRVLAMVMALCLMVGLMPMTALADDGDEDEHTITCPTCGGTEYFEPCPDCSGQGTITCGACGGQGSMYESCGGCGGSGAGETYYEYDNEGNIVNSYSESCGACGGSGGFENNCGACGGSGMEYCGGCSGNSYVYATCPTCYGTGTIIAPEWEDGNLIHDPYFHYEEAWSDDYHKGELDRSFTDDGLKYSPKVGCGFDCYISTKQGGIVVEPGALYTFSMSVTCSGDGDVQVAFSDSDWTRSDGESSNQEYFSVSEGENTITIENIRFDCDETEFQFAFAPRRFGEDPEIIPEAIFSHVSLTKMPDPEDDPGTQEPVNLALGKTVVVSSTDGTGPESYVVDGVTEKNDKNNNRWSSQYSDNEWIYIDLGEDSTIAAVKLYWEDAYATKYQIQTSTDAQNWTTVYTEYNGNGGKDEITFTPVTARYVKMQGITRVTQWGYSLYEFEVYSGKPAVEPIDPTDPTDPIDPIDPIDPVDPAEAFNAVFSPLSDYLTAEDTSAAGDDYSFRWIASTVDGYDLQSANGNPSYSRAITITAKKACQLSFDYMVTDSFDHLYVKDVDDAELLDATRGQSGTFAADLAAGDKLTISYVKVFGIDDYYACIGKFNACDVHEHTYNETAGICDVCGLAHTLHTFEDAECTVCGIVCLHESTTVASSDDCRGHDVKCNVCGAQFVEAHDLQPAGSGNRLWCTVCKYVDYPVYHTWEKNTSTGTSICIYCGTACEHEDKASHTSKIEPTCTEIGYTESFRCTGCGLEMSQNRIPALGHDFSVACPDESKAPTCTETGIDVRKCSRCDATNTEVVPADGHQYGANNICTVCGIKHPFADIFAVAAVVNDSQRPWVETTENGYRLVSTIGENDDHITSTITITAKARCRISFDYSFDTESNAGDKFSISYGFDNDEYSDSVSGTFICDLERGDVLTISFYKDFYLHDAIVCLGSFKAESLCEHDWVNGVCSVCEAVMDPFAAAFLGVSDYVKVQNHEVYPWTTSSDEDYSLMSTNNDGKSSSASFTITARTDMVFSFDFCTSADTYYDYLEIENSAITAYTIVCHGSGTDHYIAELRAGDVLTISYTKEYGGANDVGVAYIGNFRAVAAHEHVYADGVCTVCGMVCEHSSYVNSICTVCGSMCKHSSFNNGVCTRCKYECEHSSYTNGACSTCGTECEHSSYAGGICTVCGYECKHSSYVGGKCEVCGELCKHSFEDLRCTVCGYSTGVACAQCGGEGHYLPACPDCGGTGTVKCDTCNGTGRVPGYCGACGGTGIGWSEPIYDDENNYMGDNIIPCYTCDGFGEIEEDCGGCNGRGWFTCSTCNGSGKQEEEVTCPVCGGSGTVCGHLWDHGTCVACGEAHTGHAFSDDTCTVCGFICDHEGYRITEEEQDSTCTATGLTAGEHCSFCGKVFTERTTIPVKAHAFEEIPAKAPGCTETGYEAYRSCTVCGTKEGYTELAAAGHSYENGFCTDCGAEDAFYAAFNPFSEYVTAVNGEDHPWVAADMDGYALMSGNQGVNNSTSTITITAQKNVLLSFDYLVSSEMFCDKLEITVNGSNIVGTFSGEQSENCQVELNEGDILTIVYKKDGSYGIGGDRAYIGNVRAALLCEHIYAAGTCTICGINHVGHSYVDSECVVCGYVDEEMAAVCSLFAGMNVAVTNDSRYPWTTSENGDYALMSGNKDVDDSASTITITALEHLTFSFDYAVSSEEYCDQMIVAVNGGEVCRFNGEVIGSIPVELQKNDVLTITYRKDVSLGGGYDRAYIGSFASEVILPCRHTDEDKNGTCDVCGADLPVTFRNQSLTLGEEIGVNFYMTIPAELLESASVEFTVQGEKITVNSEDFVQNVKDGVTRYKATCMVNALQMAETITATLYYGEDESITKTYSVKDYVETVMSMDVSELTNGEKMKNLAMAIADYGHYAQIALAASHGFTVGEDGKYAEMDLCYNSEAMTAAEKTKLADYAKTENDPDHVLSKVTYSLRLDAETVINLYLTTADGNKPTVTVNGKTVTVTKDGSRYRVQIKGISAHELGDIYTVMVNGSAEIRISALSYVNATVNNAEAKPAEAKPANVDMVTALYRYYTATMAYRPTK